MTLSDIIAITVGAVFILGCGYLFCKILLRKKLEASGYTLDWKKNPVGMMLVLVSLVVCPAVIIWGFFLNWR